MIVDAKVRESLTVEWQEAFRETEIIWQPTTVSDFMFARRRFKITFKLDASANETVAGVWELAAKRGTIRDGRPVSDSP